MSAISGKTSFVDLMKALDADHKDVDKTQYKRELLYYSVIIDGEATNIVARHTHNEQTNNTRLFFLLRTEQGASEYNLLYLSEFDVVYILSKLKGSLYDHVMNYIVSLYREDVDLEAHITEFQREALIPGVGAFSTTASYNVLTIPRYGSVQEIETPFGYNVSFESFCDDLSMLLSMEPVKKLKVTLIKYYVLSNLLRVPPKAMPIPRGLVHIKSHEDVEKVYMYKRYSQARKFDLESFKPVLYDEYFASIE